MDYLISSGDIIYIVSDITAGVFLTVLVISTITHRTSKRPGFTHLFAATMLILAGIFTRFFALVMGMQPDGTMWNPGLSIPMPRSAGVIWIMGFILITIGICESTVHTIYVNEGKIRSIFKPIYSINSIIIVAGIILFATIQSIDAFTLADLMLLLCLLFYLHKNSFDRAVIQFRRASMIAITTFVIPLFFGSVRLTGLGLSLMLIILNEQYHDCVERDLAENEVALAKSKLQLLTEQISPHYIYNSLQSIRDLCGKDPVKARDAVDFFSEYLRGNLESLTTEELIPFARELELTQAYLELEKLTGRRSFEVSYELETTDFMLPPLVLQPLVENAVQHGAGNGLEGVTINIATHESEEAVCIEVTDRSVSEGMSEHGNIKTGMFPSADVDPHETAKKSKKKKNIGLENVRTRIAIQCGGSLEISGFRDGTKVTIILPKTPKTITLQEL